jgi:hypothetical protein
MRKDVHPCTNSCDVCQKIKVDHRKKKGGLRPSHIPTRPFEAVSLDPIAGLPPSGAEMFTAILVIVDKLTKYAIIVPTYDTLNQEGFAKLFVERVVNVYGHQRESLPTEIVTGYCLLEVDSSQLWQRHSSFFCTSPSD